MPGISIHVVDVSRGVVAKGMRVELAAVGEAGPERLIASGTISGNGLLDHPALGGTFDAGFYVVRFHIAEYYRAALAESASPPFLDLVHYRFGLADPAAHYHLPMKCTPWGYSCFRGGA